MIRPIAPPPARKRRKPSLKITIRRAIDATTKSGVPVNSVRVFTDGSFILSSVPMADTGESSPFDQWKERL